MQEHSQKVAMFAHGGCCKIVTAVTTDDMTYSGATIMCSVIRGMMSLYVDEGCEGGAATLQHSIVAMLTLGVCADSSFLSARLVVY